ncbi:hypothetical protein LUZ60_015934 [Juncus effusus]|nr:hypothetical protein LUZ60_015934 [Juncus effusus]
MASFQNSKNTLLPLLTPLFFLFLTFSTITNGRVTERTFQLPAVEKKTHISFYFNEVIAGAPNATDFIVAGPNKTSYAFTDVTVYDDPMRETEDLNSLLLGRVQGLVAYTSMVDLSAITLENIVFTTGKYEGSTLSILGWLPNITDWIERPVVGGTGYFRLARGSVFTKILTISDTTYVVKFDLHVLHY